MILIRSNNYIITLYLYYRRSVKILCFCLQNDLGYININLYYCKSSGCHEYFLYHF